MNFSFSRERLTGRERWLERFFEILPGATSWTILLGMTALAFWRPVVAAILIIAFDLYWLLRLFYMTLFLLLSSLRLTIERKTDWMARVRCLESRDANTRMLDQRRAPLSLQERISDWCFGRELTGWINSGVQAPRADALVHLVIIPIAKERRAVVEPGLRSLTQQQISGQQIVVMLAVEGWTSAEVQQDVAWLQQQYRREFSDLLVAVHPDGLPGEARVKGANVTYAAKMAAAYFQAKQIPFEHVVVSCFDADTVVSPGYFGCLTYQFMRTPERTQASFQPIPVYNNNIWEVPGFARVLDIGSSFFQLVEAANPGKLVTFSSHSMSFKALVEIGYWPVDIISDDSAIFWKAFIHFDGRYRVVPMYVTLSMDVAAAGSWWKTALHVYKQKRRWAWGVENFPIVMRAFLRAKAIPLSLKFQHGFKLFESHVAWATSALLLSIISWLPVVLVEREFSSTVLFYSTPRMTGAIFNIASLSLGISILLSLSLLPKRQVRFSFLRRLGHALEWLVVPLTAVWLGALPALDAQTRLMFGQYMEFWVTEKQRTSTPSGTSR